MSDQVTISPRHPSVSVEDLIVRLHADGWTAVELRVAPDPLSDGRRHIARASRAVEVGTAPQFAEHEHPYGHRSISHSGLFVFADAWGHSANAALADLVELIDEHRIAPAEVAS